MPTPPSLSPEQREAALEKAAAARRVRAETKDRLKMGLVSFDELLELADTDELVGKMKALACLLYTSPSPRDRTRSRMPSSA